MAAQEDPCERHWKVFELPGVAGNLVVVFASILRLIRALAKP